MASSEKQVEVTEMKWTISALVTLMTLIIAGVFGKAQDGQRSADKSLEQILTDKRLWGRDFPKALATLPQFERAGETHIVVMHAQVVSAVGTDTKKLAPMAE